MPVLDIMLLFDHADQYMEGLRNTLLASVLALMGSFMIGTIIAVLRLTPIKLLRGIGTAYVEFFRNISSFWVCRRLD